MVVVEVTLAVVLLAGAGLLIRSFQELYSIDLGFDPARVLTGRITLVARKYPEPEDRLQFVERLQRRLDAMPGIRAASVATTFPLFGGAQRSLEIDGRPWRDSAAAPTVTMLGIGARYFESVGVSLTRGRTLTLEDGREGAGVGRRERTVRGAVLSRRRPARAAGFACGRRASRPARG